MNLRRRIDRLEEHEAGHENPGERGYVTAADLARGCKPGACTMRMRTPEEHEDRMELLHSLAEAGTHELFSQMDLGKLERAHRRMQEAGVVYFDLAKVHQFYDAQEAP